MPEFYHDLITEKSFEVLQGLRRKFNFILIGGWAVFLYTKALKSKDIDIVLDYDELAKFKARFDVFKNERLKKYEAKTGEIDIDIYSPHYSRIGLPVEDIKKHRHSLEGFTVPSPEILLVLKAFVLQERQRSAKGKKDLLDIFSLLKEAKIDWRVYKSLIQKYNLGKLNQAIKEVISSSVRMPEIGLTNHKMARLKKEVLKNL